MPVFKNLMSMLFGETDEEIIVEDELETIEFKEKKKPKSDPIVKEDDPSPREKHVEGKVIKQQAQEEKKKFVSIDLEEKKIEDKKKEVKESTTARPVLKKNDSSKDFEFTPVISPMFGAKEEKKKEQKNQSVKIMKRSNTVKKKPNPLGTIISPYYGVNELEEFEEEAMEEIAAKQQEQATPIETPKHDVEIEELNQMEEVENVTLDELLEDVHDTTENDEDLMQISLFGDSTPVQEVEETYKYKNEE